MIPIAEALRLIEAQTKPLPVVEMAAVDALGMTLAEDVASDIDSPPYAKALVDGYAVVADDLKTGSARLKIIEEVTAGRVPTKPIAAGLATRIMTGAPLPEGCDAAVMVETTEVEADPAGGLGHVVISGKPMRSGNNVMPRALAMQRGQQVLAAGSSLRPAEIGLLAEVGRVRVSVIARPRVAVLSTGDEVVPAETVPQVAQIRNSNSPLLASFAASCGATPIALGIAPDEPGLLRVAIQRGLEADMLVLSGGVSAGVLDLVPKVLDELGVQQVFHKVQLKPGKPVWFGTLSGEDSTTLVFGLPGNPVGALVAAMLLVRPALRCMAGQPFTATPTSPATLSTPFKHKGQRPTYHPAALGRDDNGATVEPLAWHGSADLCTLSRANVLVHFPGEQLEFPAGERVEFVEL